jgi:ribonucleotide reductase beta subunit family protein with ferritin-like domain
LYELQAERYWTVKEINFSEDYKCWQQLSADEQKFISVTLAFFANADNLVIENLHSRLRAEIQFPECQSFFCIQSAVEIVHSLTYAESINVVIRDPVQRMELFRAIDNNPIVQPKLNWTKKWIESTESLGKRLVAMALVEGVFFSSSFASLFWARKRRNLPGICFSNEKIVEDEALHVLHYALLYRKYIINKLPLEELYEMVREAVAIEHEFVENALPVRLIDMNSTEMKQYVCFVTDLVLEMLGVPKLYNCENPFEWMVGIGLVGKSNFFEKRVAEYVLAGLESEIRQVEFLSLGDKLGF